jgi:hypothetical protein
MNLLFLKYCSNKRERCYLAVYRFTCITVVKQRNESGDIVMSSNKIENVLVPQGGLSMKI